MAIITATFLFYSFITFTVVLVYSYLKFKFSLRYHWKRLNIPYIEPLFIFGNTWKTNFFEPLSITLKKIYLENKDKPVLGIWNQTRPVLLINDVNLIRNVLVKDFQNFHDRGDRGFIIDVKKDPLQGHLFNLSGTKWRNLRIKLSPTFTSGKMKMMFPSMVECGEELQNVLKGPAENSETIEVKDMSARFTTDVISSCAFGIQTNSLKNPNAEFRKYGRKIFNPGWLFVIRRRFLANFKFLRPFFWGRRHSPEVNNFFMNVIKETMETREKNNIQRNDFIDLMIQLRNKGFVEEADTNSEKESSPVEFTFEVAAAQVFGFFAAGFETSSATMQFALYELALNPDLQRKLQSEIDLVLARYDYKVTYEAVQEMEYLDCVVNETLRKYPAVPILARTCTKEYTFPDSNIKIEENTGVFIPIIGIQNDPQYFPNPDKFDPERFLAEEKGKRDKFLHIPFGEGPRMCIGNRFGLLQTKIGLIFVLSKYKVEVSDKTPIPLKLDPRTFTPSTIKGMHLKISRR